MTVTNYDTPAALHCDLCNAAHRMLVQVNFNHHLRSICGECLVRGMPEISCAKVDNWKWKKGREDNWKWKK